MDFFDKGQQEEETLNLDVMNFFKNNIDNHEDIP